MNMVDLTGARSDGGEGTWSILTVITSKALKNIWITNWCLLYFVREYLIVQNGLSSSFYSFSSDYAASTC